MQISIRKKNFWWLLILGLMLWPSLSPAQTSATLQGDVASQLARLLGLEPTSPAQTIAALTNLGIIPQGGWNPKSPASQEFIASLFDALVKALQNGGVALPVGLPDASSLLAAALTSSGRSSTETVQNLALIGGGGIQAYLGAGRGIGLGGPALSAGGGGGLGGRLPDECPGFRQRPGGTGGGGSGCVGTQSR